MTDGMPEAGDPTEDDAGYPRPALGRRPWFAFLRRAMILRRFALAMGGERTRPPRRRIPVVELRTAQWSSGPVLVARSRTERRRGLAPACGPFGLLVAGRSLVRAGLTGAVGWIGIGSGGTVVAAGRLGRFVRCRKAAVMVEVAVHLGLPPVGAVLTVAPILAAWPAP